MALRPFHLPSDLSQMAELLPQTFQYPENQAWSLQEDELHSILDLTTSARRLWPVISILRRFTPALRDVLHGFIWEEDAKAVGLVNISRDGSSDDWIISNVGVLPDFRRRGIARQLVEAAVAFARAHRARHIRLSVIAGNVPAHDLYASLGFVQYASSTTVQHDAPDPAPSPASDSLQAAGYIADAVALNAWRPFYELAGRITPTGVARYQPVTPERFQMPRSMQVVVRLINTMSGVHDRRLIVREAGGHQVVATMTLNAHGRGSSINSCQMMLDPAHAQLASYLVRTTLHTFAQLSPQNRIQCEIPHWQPELVEATLSNAFKQHYESHWMGM